jgi:hypothetical protein
LMGIHAQIDHRANEHIAAEAAEDVEVKCFHLEREPAARALIWLAA